MSETAVYLTPEIIIVAGPNGGGKTTFALDYLPTQSPGAAFVNADQIAMALDSLNPAAAAVSAGRLMLAEIDRLASKRRNFAFETTLSGRAYLGRIARWRQMGYRVTLIFLSLESPEAAISRVRSRVEQGGHDIPEDVVRRRFYAGLENFWKHYAGSVDYWEFYDNMDQVPVLVERRATNG